MADRLESSDIIVSIALAKGLSLTHQYLVARRKFRTFILYRVLEVLQRYGAESV